MLWPILLVSAPIETPWSLGDQIATRLRWCDAPNLPGDVVMHQVRACATVLIGGDGQPWAQLIEAGALVAARPGRGQTGEITISGCAGYDVYLQSVDQVPATVGIVRRLRVIMDLHDRGSDRWIPRPGALRMIDVPDASPTRLRDDPSLDDRAPPDYQPAPGSLQLLSPEQYFARFRDRLPATAMAGPRFPRQSGGIAEPCGAWSSGNTHGRWARPWVSVARMMVPGSSSRTDRAF